jgi:hypothetical protein
MSVLLAYFIKSELDLTNSDSPRVMLWPATARVVPVWNAVFQQFPFRSAWSRARTGGPYPKVGLIRRKERTGGSHGSMRYIKSRREPLCIFESVRAVVANAGWCYFQPMAKLFHRA